MSAKIYITKNTLKPSWKVSIESSENGRWRATHEFSCNYTDYANPEIQNRLVKNVTPLTDLDPNIPLKFSFLKLATYRPEHQRGGITKVRCVFTGVDPEEGSGSGGNDRSKTYSYRGTLISAPIIEHPNYLKEVTNEREREAITALYNGSAYSVNDGKLYIRDKVSDRDLVENGFGNLTNGEKWAKKILSGTRTYHKPTLEWSINQTNQGGMTAEELEGYGQKVDAPEGNPPKPTWAENAWWMFAEVDESKTNRDSSYSRTYRLMHEKYDEDIYGNDKVPAP